MRATILLAAVILLGGCHITRPDTFDPTALPYPKVPALPPEAAAGRAAASPGMVWVPTGYEWNGNGYELQPGRWSPPAGPTALWQSGHWILLQNRQYEWLRGRWVEM
jgi:hypothetical protein